ncbi:hypothetical protein AOLI_G00321990 [Acnodon oligacanthus]
MVQHGRQPEMLFLSPSPESPRPLSHIPPRYAKTSTSRWKNGASVSPFFNPQGPVEQLQLITELQRIGITLQTPAGLGVIAMRRSGEGDVYKYQRCFLLGLRLALPGRARRKPALSEMPPRLYGSRNRRLGYYWVNILVTAVRLGGCPAGGRLVFLNSANEPDSESGCRFVLLWNGYGNRMRGFALLVSDDP